MRRKCLTAFCSAILLAGSAACFAAAHGSDSGSTKRAKAALARLDAIIEKNQCLSFEANVTISIRSWPLGFQEDKYKIKGLFQHQVYARFDEIQDGKTVFTVNSNPQHLYIYSPITGLYEDDGNVPVYFAVWDMLTASGWFSDKLAPYSRWLGYYFDITGYFGAAYGPACPWDKEPKIASQHLTDTLMNGRKVERLVLKMNGSNYSSAWTIFLDPKADLPLQAVFSGIGPSMIDNSHGKSSLTITEDYTAFAPSKTQHPESDFAFTPPPGAKEDNPETDQNAAPK